jgi:RNA polymerase sigma-70 factor (ECF subfamily)
MGITGKEQLEAEVRGLALGGDHAGAATAAIRGLGSEIFGFLMGTHRETQAADELFALWSERVWRGLASFAWECSLRTWCYAIAHNLSSNFRRDARVRVQRALPLPESSQLAAVQQAVRSETRPYQRTDVKDRFAALRATLTPEDQTLLVLRVDKQLAWKDLARVMADDATSDAAALARSAQRLRKRYQLLKDRLVELGRGAGLVE